MAPTSTSTVECWPRVLLLVRASDSPKRKRTGKRSSSPATSSSGERATISGLKILVDPAVIGHPAVLALAEKHVVSSYLRDAEPRILYLSERAHFFASTGGTTPGLVEFAVKWARKEKKGGKT